MAAEQAMTQTGALAANLHEGSRSEYLAQFAFSSFGTSIPVPHPEDTGLDLYCTLVDRQGPRAWPRAYFSVQVKSGLTPWEFNSPESVRWIIEHPLPVFLCVVLKSELRILVYPTTPRFAVWTHPWERTQLKMIPLRATEASMSAWAEENEFTLDAPILDFTLQDVLDDGFRQNIIKILKAWVEIDVENLFRIKSGIHHFRVPTYKTNSARFTGWTQQGHGFRQESLEDAKTRLEELLGSVANHEYQRGSLTSAAIYAIALRRLDPEGRDEWTAHNPHLHNKLNAAFGAQPTYLYETADSLLAMVIDELEKHGIADSEAAGVQVKPSQET
jgi:hypothetical protein